jgi:hypothetical protein
MVGTLDAVHSLMAPRFSEGLRKMATSGRWEFAAMGPRPKLLFSSLDVARREEGFGDSNRWRRKGNEKRSQEVASGRIEIEKVR